MAPPLLIRLVYSAGTSRHLYLLNPLQMYPHSVATVTAFVSATPPTRTQAQAHTHTLLRVKSCPWCFRLEPGLSTASRVRVPGCPGPAPGSSSLLLSGVSIVLCSPATPALLFYFNLFNYQTVKLTPYSLSAQLSESYHAY